MQAFGKKRTKKLLIILCIIAAMAVLGILVYNFVWLQSLHHMKPDGDSGAYDSGWLHYIDYHDGVLSVYNPENNSIEVFQDDNKKVFSLNGLTTPRQPYYNDQYIVVEYNNGYTFYNLDLSKAGEYNFPEKMNSHSFYDGYYYCTSDDSIYQCDVNNFSYKAVYSSEDTGEKINWSIYDSGNYYCGNSKNIYKCSLKDFTTEVVYTTDSYEINDCCISNNIMYIEHHDKNFKTSTILKYDLDAKKVIDTYKADISYFNVDSDLLYSLNLYDGQLYYYNTKTQYDSITYVSKYDLENRELKYISEFKKEFFIKEDNLYYIGNSKRFKTQDESADTIGLRRLNLDTMETVLISDKVDYSCTYFCTDNYAYSYKVKDISWDSGLPSLPIFRIYRGYTLDQIPLN